MMKVRSLQVAVFFFLSTVTGISGRAAEKPNILFLLADDMRPDAVAAHGNPRISTPNIDSLVERGMSFSRASCSNPICVASRAEMLTGRHGWENGITAIAGAQVKEKESSWWGHALQAGGYETWYVGKWHTSGNVHDRGFTKVDGFYKGGGGKWWKPAEDWKGFPITGYTGWIFQSADGKTKYPELGVGLTPDISSKFADAAIRLIEKQGEKPWFLHLSFTAPHDPLFVPPGLEGKYKTKEMKLPENFLPVHPFDHGNLTGRDEALLAWPRTEEAVKDLLRVYYAVVDDMDAQIGRVLNALEATGEMENTVIIFSSDHGMSCGSHGLRGKQNMYEHTINVPLVVAGPGIAAGSKTEAQVYLRELYPTTCDLAGVKIPEQVTAKSFAPVLRGKKDAHHETIYGYFRNDQRMMRTNDGWKIIYYPERVRYQLFDLNSDPFETNDLAGNPEHREKMLEMIAGLEEWRDKAGDPLGPE
jgi:arylsulfatase A-like enzyme